MSDGYKNIGKIPELRKRIIFTFLMLVAYRLGAHIPTPGINGDALSAFFAQMQGTILGLFDMFSGGALERLSIFALGIMPYISSSIIFQLLTVVVPYLHKLSKEGEMGRKKITQYTRYGTVALSIIQGIGISFGLEKMTGPAGELVVPHPGWTFRIMAVITLTAGTAFIMWLGEQITERGIGNGISLIIFAGIVVRMPSATVNTLKLVRTGEFPILLVLFLIVMMVAVVGFIIFMERAQRKIPVQYAKRVVGRKVFGGQSTHLPLKVNSAGVIPAIFASSIIMFPATLAQFSTVPFMQKVAGALTPGSWPHEILYVAFIVFFCYFYTAVTFNPTDVADNMKKYGGYIPGIRPGQKTADYIDRILTKITFAGAMYLAIVCVLPTILVQQMKVPFYFGGTSLLIVVGVALDTVAQIESHLLQRHYDGFMGKARIKGRR